ncbi:polymorphic toxin-type HINT domain-containing protein [Thermopolyspora sp. NPDC052614]|uniref:polymorphic toxin-type HINT domain-containing protein n=1 Tax=Thermopolyspora sp. NPDC052614 TaxID=3155682 RepID=UPI00343AA841
MDGALALTDQIQAQQAAVISGKPVEIAAAGSPTSRIVANPDGRTFTAQLWNRPQRVKRGAGWQQVDTTLVESGTVLRPKVPGPGVDVEFSTGGSGPFVTMRLGEGRSYALRWPTPLPKPEIQGNVATYPAAAAGADLVVTALPTGFRHDVVLHQRPTGPVEYPIHVQADGVKLHEDGTTGGLRIRDGDTVLATAPAPLMRDSSGSGPGGKTRPARTKKIDITVRQADGDGQLLVLTPDTGFLTDPATTYPVTLDPTTTLPGTTSASIYSDDQPAWALDVGTSGTPSDPVYQRALLKFDLSALQGKQISSASLKLWNVFSWGCPTSGLVVNRVTQAWEPWVTWSDQPSVTGTGQATATDPQNCNEQGDVEWSWPITQIVQAWASGAANHGLRVKGATESGSQMYERIFNNELQPEHTPVISITFSSPGVEGFETQPSLTLGGQNVATSLTPTLATTVAVPVADGARVDYELQHDPAAPAQGTGQIWTGSATGLVHGRKAYATVPAGKLTDGWRVQWRARISAHTDGATPTWSPWQNLRIDTSAVPATPTNSTEDGYLEVESIRYEYEIRTNGATAPTGATMVILNRQRLRERFTDGRYRFSDARAFFDAYGSPIKIHDFGQDGVPADNVCTTHTYARNTAGGKWMIDFPATTEARKGDDCSGGPLVSRTVNLYDGSTDPDANTPMWGNVTEKREWSDADTFSATKNGYDAYGRTTSVTNPLGKTTTTTYNPAVGWPANGVTVTNQLGHAATTWSSHLHGEPVGIRDPNGHDINVDYDALGRATTLWTPEKPKSGDTPAARVTYRIPVDNDTGKVTAATSTTTDHLRSGSGPDAKWTTSHTYFDGFGNEREEQTASPAGGRIVTVTMYDGRGNTAIKAEPVHNTDDPGSGLLNPEPADLPQWTKTTYDHLGRAIAEVKYSGSSEHSRTTTRHLGDRTEIVPPVGAKTVHHTDVDGLITKIEEWVDDSTHNDTTNTYDVNGWLTKTIDANGNVRTYAYDLLGRRIASTDPDTGETQQHFDSGGRLAWTLDAKGQKISHTYDDLGRRTGMWAGDPGTGVKLAEWVYDTLAKGEITSATRYVEGNAYTERVTGYDSMGRPTGTTVTIPASEGPLAGDYTLTAAYNNAGELTEVGMPAAGGLPAEKLTFEYTDLGLAKGLTSDFGGGFTYVKDTLYSPTARLTERSYGPNGQVKRNLTWDTATGWLSRLTTTAKADTSSPQLVQDDQYTYDLSGEITRILDAASAVTGGTEAQSECFTYDGRHRLTAAWTTTATSCAGGVSAADGRGIDPYAQTYTYDAVGNITTLTDSGQTSTFSYPAAGASAVRPNAVSTITRPSGTDTFTYDANGRMIAKVTDGKTHTYEWDESGQLTKAVVDGQTSQYVYTADGDRLIRRDPDKTTLYLDGTELELTVANGHVTGKRYYVSADAAVVAMRTAGQPAVTWLASDGRNSTQIAIDDATGVATRQRYLPYGASRGGRDDILLTDRGFLGKTEDAATGLIQLGHRYYDPSITKFLSPDPLINISEPQLTNAYGYAGGNPIGLTDREGLEPHPGHDKNWLKKSEKERKRITEQHFRDHRRILKAAQERQRARADQARKEQIRARNQVAAHRKANGSGGGKSPVKINIKTLEIEEREPIPAWQQGILMYVGRYYHLVNAGIYCSLGSKEQCTDALQAAAGMGKQIVRPKSTRPCSSFVPGTRVLMADGTYKNIEELKVGDMVIATDPKTEKTQDQPVIAVITSRGAKRLVKITVDTDNDAGNQTGTVMATETHPFWVANEHRWIHARHLRHGMQLESAQGDTFTVVRTRQFNRSDQQVYNLTVDHFHTYFVGVGGIDALVHNAQLNPPDPIVRGLPSLNGMTQTQADATLYKHGFYLHSISQSGAYATYKASDGSTVTIRLADGRVTRTTKIDMGPNKKNGTQRWDDNGNKILDHDHGENLKC